MNTSLARRALAAALSTLALVGHASELPKKDAHIIPIAALTANGDLVQLRTALNDGLDTGLSVNEIKEVVSMPSQDLRPLG